MLSKEAIQEALPLTESFDEKDIALVPIEGTLLEQLVGQTITLDGDSGVDIDSTSKYTNTPELLTGASEHDMIVDEGVKVLAESVRKHFHYAKTVVAPLVGEYVDLVQEDIAKMPQSGLAKYNIKPYKAPEPFDSALFRQSLNAFAETAFENVDLNLNLPDMSIEDLNALMSLGESDVDGLLTQFTSRVGGEFISTIYRTVFQLVQNTDEDYSKVVSLRTVMDDKVSGNDAAVVIYVLSTRLHDNPGEGVNQSLDEYNQALVRIRNQSGNKLFRINRELEEAFKNNRLVRSTDGLGGVSVYSETYEDWIANGGDNDVLLASQLAEKAYFTVSQINEDAASLKELWEKNKVLEVRTSFNNRFSYIKESLKTNFIQILQKQDLDIAERNTAVDILGGELDLIKVDEINNIPNLCLRIMTRGMFWKTDAEKILSSIENIGTQNPGIDVREAALIAFVELITDYWCAQIKPESTY